MPFLGSSCISVCSFFSLIGQDYYLLQLETLVFLLMFGARFLMHYNTVVTKILSPKLIPPANSSSEIAREWTHFSIYKLIANLFTFYGTGVREALLATQRRTVWRTGLQMEHQESPFQWGVSPGDKPPWGHVMLQAVVFSSMSGRCKLFVRLSIITALVVKPVPSSAMREVLMWPHS